MSVQPLQQVVIENTTTGTVPFNASCYICYETDNLIKSPCVCIDLYVHANCLKEWITRRTNVNNNLKCTLCKSTYDTEKISNDETNQELINCINRVTQNHEEDYIPLQGVDFLTKFMFGLFGFSIGILMCLIYIPIATNKSF